MENRAFILGRGNWPEIKPHWARIGVEINAIKKRGTYLPFCD